MSKKDLSTTHYEIEFTDLEDNNEVFNVEERLNNFMNFAVVLNNKK